MRNLSVPAVIAAVACLTAGCAAVASPHGGSGSGSGSTRMLGGQSGPWQVRITYLPGASGPGNAPGQLVALSPTDAWVIGTTGVNFYPYADRWDGRAWRRLAVPVGAAKLMGSQPSWDALAASSPGNVWLFGPTAAQKAGRGPADAEVWLNYHDGRLHWGLVRLPGKAGSAPSYALATGSDGVWVFGDVFVWRYQQGKWARGRLPGRGAPIVSAAAVSPGNVWALRSYGEDGNRTGGALLHYSGGRWRQVPLPTAMRGALVGSLVACGANCAWISGGVTNSERGTTEAIARWTGRRWYISTPPVQASHRQLNFSAILADGFGGLWAYGNPDPQKAPLWQFARNVWTRPTFATKALLTGPPLASIPGSTSFWSTAWIFGQKRGQAKTGIALISRRRIS